MARSRRHQTGQIIERSGSFYLRYYTTVLRDGKRVRERPAEFLCEKARVYRSASCKAVKDLAAKRMAEINESSGRPTEPDIPIHEFWAGTYLPWAEENLRPSSVAGYRKIWKQRLAPHFDGLTLREYRTSDGSRFLTSLAKSLSRNSLSHVRSLASGVFSHAVNLGLLRQNPFRECKVLAKTRDAAPTRHYTLEQASAVMKVLEPRTDACAVFALCFFLGLRPSEVSGLTWDCVDFEKKVLWIKRSVVGRVVGPTKTEDSTAELPLMEPVLGLLEKWAEMSGLGLDYKAPQSSPDGPVHTPTSPWVFPSKTGPLNIQSLTFHVMRPMLQASGVEWLGLYAARRGNGSVLTQLTGDAMAAFEVLRHRSLATTTGHYIKPSKEKGLTGLKLLEQAYGQQSGTN